METTSENYYSAPSPGISPPMTGFNIRQPIRVVCLRLNWIPPILLVSIILGVLTAFLWPPTYEARTIIKSPIKGSTQDQLLDGQIAVAYPGADDPTGNFMAIALSDNVVHRIMSMLSLGPANPNFKGMSDGQIFNRLKRMIAISPIGNSDLISFATRAPTASFASDLANTWAQAFMLESLDLSHKEALSQNQFLKEQADEYEKRIKNPNRGLNARSKTDDAVYKMITNQIEETEISAQVDTTGMIVMTPATPPVKPVFPKKKAMILGIIFLGLISCVGSMFLSDFLKSTVNCQVPMEKISRLPNYPFVPDFRDELERKPTDFQAPPGKNSLITNPQLKGSRFSESFKLLGANLSSVRTEYPMRVLGIFSARNKEGKTLASANLAISLARAGRKVLLVDADFQTPSIAKLFEVSFEGGGLPRLLEGSELSGLTVPSGIANLWILPTAPGASDQASPLDSIALDQAIEKMKKEFEVVIFDTAPLLPSSDPLILASLLDGVILITRWNFTKFQDFSNALKFLRSVEAPVLGTLLNGVQMNKGLPTWLPEFRKWLWEE